MNEAEVMEIREREETVKKRLFEKANHKSRKAQSITVNTSRLLLLCINTPINKSTRQTGSKEQEHNTSYDMEFGEKGKESQMQANVSTKVWTRRRRYC